MSKSVPKQEPCQAKKHAKPKSVPKQEPCQSNLLLPDCMKLTKQGRKNLASCQTDTKILVDREAKRA